MTRLVVVIGGTRSGKSAYAERLVAAVGGRVLVVGTLLGDTETGDARITAHRERRPASWTTAEVGPDGALTGPLRAAGPHDALLVDGYELMVALAAPPDDAQAATAARAAAAACRLAATRLACIVTSEVGLGVHPSSPAGVTFRDRVGAANQALAEAADGVVLVVAGLTLTLKGAP